MAFNVEFQTKKYSKPLLHALSPNKGLVESIFSILYKVLSEYLEFLAELKAKLVISQKRVLDLLT